VKEKKIIPSELNRDNPCSELGNLLEDRLREIKVLLWGIAPPPCIVWESIVWWAEVGASDHNGSRETPLPIVHAFDLIARPTAQPVVEQSSTQRRCVSPIPLAVEIPIPTSSSCNTYRHTKSIRREKD